MPILTYTISGPTRYHPGDWPAVHSLPSTGGCLLQRAVVVHHMPTRLCTLVALHRLHLVRARRRLMLDLWKSRLISARLLPICPEVARGHGYRGRLRPLGDDQNFGSIAQLELPTSLDNGEPNRPAAGSLAPLLRI